MITENEDWLANYPEPIDKDLIRYSNLYYLPDYPLSAFGTLKVISILRQIRDEKQKDHLKRHGSGYSPHYAGLTAAISYFEVMGDAKSEQEHQDAFCTPIIEVP